MCLWEVVVASDYVWEITVPNNWYFLLRVRCVQSLRECIVEIPCCKITWIMQNLRECKSMFSVAREICLGSVRIMLIFFFKKNMHSRLNTVYQQCWVFSLFKEPARFRHCRDTHAHTTQQPPPQQHTEAGTDMDRERQRKKTEKEDGERETRQDKTRQDKTVFHDQGHWWF